MADNPVYIVEYDQRWPLAFAHIKEVVSGEMKELAREVKHVGSTSVPALAAKPIIDIIVVIESESVLDEVNLRLQGLGYHHEGDGGIPKREAYKREGDDVPRDGKGSTWPQHHLYVCPQDSPELARQLAFRDFLRKNHKVADAYARLKCRLAEIHRHNREAYTDGKSEFVGRILRRAGCPYS